MCSLYDYKYYKHVYYVFQIDFVNIMCGFFVTYAFINTVALYVDCTIRKQYILWALTNSYFVLQDMIILVYLWEIIVW